MRTFGRNVRPKVWLIRDRDTQRSLLVGAVEGLPHPDLRRRTDVNGLAAEFPLTDGLVMLNHASFGVCTRRMLQAASDLRLELEADPIRHLGPELLDRITAVTDLLAAELALPPGGTTMTANATSGASALMRSIELGEHDTVVVLSTEYSSVQRGWQVRCREAGADYRQVDVPQPLEDVDELLDCLDAQVEGAVRVLQLSLVSSSSALLMPVAELARWGHSRGAVVVVDAAHGPGHVALRMSEWGADAVYGTLHKWLPVPRPLGFLALAPGIDETVRPAEVSLTWDSPDLVERFSWPGTYDPVPRLLLPLALDEWRAWSRAGVVSAAESLADAASDELTVVGAVPTSTRAFLSPRLRAFTLPGVRREDLDAECAAAGIRAWTRADPAGATVLRVALHVYNDEADVETAARLVRGLILAAARG